MKLSNMAHVLRAAGLTVVETPGWSTRGYAGRDLQSVSGILWHHTATHRSRFASSDAPTLSMCINGRPDLPGPLCHIVFGRNGTVYLTAAGLANHAGVGSAPGIPRDTGNYHLIGIEMESSGIAPWDWTPDQIRVAPLLGAALERGFLSHLPEDQRIQMAHYEYSSQGKIDPAGWPGGMDGLRSAINDALRGKAAPTPEPVPAPAPKEEDEMLIIATAPEENGKIWIGNGLTRRHIPNPFILDAYRKMHGWGLIKLWKDGEVAQLPAEALGVDVTASDVEQNAQIKALIGAVAALSKGEKFDEAKLLAGVKSAAEEGTRSAIESITTTVNFNKGE